MTCYTSVTRVQLVRLNTNEQMLQDFTSGKKYVDLSCLLYVTIYQYNEDDLYILISILPIFQPVDTHQHEAKEKLSINKFFFYL